MRRENSPQNAAGHTFVILTIIIGMDKHQTADHCSGASRSERKAGGEKGNGRAERAATKGRGGTRAIVSGDVKLSLKLAAVENST